MHAVRLVNCLVLQNHSGILETLMCMMPATATLFEILS